MQPPTMLAFMDVYYHEQSATAQGARAAAVMASHWQATASSSTIVVDIDEVADYEPGAFYRRELPSLLALLKALPQPPDLLVIDGYVWLDAQGRPGLGAHLHEALSGRIPVVGIAKTAFAGAENCSRIIPVLRGGSKRPLFVTAVGTDLQEAASWVAQMSGKHRIPDLLKQVDALSRSRDTLCALQAPPTAGSTFCL